MSNDPKTRPEIPVKEHPEAIFVPPQEQEPDVAAKNGKQTRGGIIQGAAPAKTPDSITAEDYDKLKDAEKWQILIKAFRQNRRSLLRIPGVIAVDIGYKIKDDSFIDKLAVRIHVERKLPDETKETIFKDRPCDFIPKVNDEKKNYFRLKKFDVPTDVIEADYKPVQGLEPPRPRAVVETPKEEAARRRRLDPLVGGISIGSPQVPVGTLGALVWDKEDGSVCILSNWHVLSGDLQAEAGNPCFQPGRFDQGRSSDVVARLKRWSFDNQTDAAIAELTGSRHYCAGEIVEMFQQISGSTDPHLGMRVLKSGRSTGFTWGFVDGLYFSSVIEYSNGVVQVFEDQIHIAPAVRDVLISGPGDSGSVWVTETTCDGYKAVGLHFAGDLPHSSFGEYALANPMSLVEKRLNFSFRPRFLEIRDEDVVTTPLSLPFELNGNGKGVHPVGVIAGGRLRGPGDHGDPIVVQPTGG